MVCLQEQSSVYKTQQHVHGVFTGTPVSTKHNNHVHGVFTGTVRCLHVHGVFTGTPVSTKHNNHVHGVFTGTVQCLQNTTDMSMVCLQEQSSVYKTQHDGVFTGTWCV